VAILLEGATFTIVTDHVSNTLFQSTETPISDLRDAGGIGLRNGLRTWLDADLMVLTLYRDASFSFRRRFVYWETLYRNAPTMSPGTG
jgi:hypothetical protein